MKVIVLKSKIYGDKVAIVDDEDYDEVMKYKWFINNPRKKNNFYASRRINKKYISMHRFIMGVSDKSVQVDHIDRNGLNNQKKNLRLCNNQENHCNIISRGGSSKYKGVSYDKNRNKWSAEITNNFKKFHLGRFDDEVSAAIAYNKAAIIYHKDFARLNKIEL